MTFSLLYRGPLSSCNYSCAYCPFAKRVDSRSQLRGDRASLERFVNWIAEQSAERWRILFTPWGEALIRPWYRAAMIRMSQMPQVDRVCVQTNLSCSTAWIGECNVDRLSLWATYHPTEVDAAEFAAKVLQLRSSNVQLSVGMVAVPGTLGEIQAMRDRLPADVYLWLNAQQPRRRPYADDELARLSEIDPQFRFTLRPERSRGLPCPTGEDAFTVDGAGAMRRCHFVDEVIGNIYAPQWRHALRPRRCPNATCTCYLGMSQLRFAELAPFYGEHLLERMRAS
jgi:organic radical activating enzyme